MNKIIRSISLTAIVIFGFALTTACKKSIVSLTLDKLFFRKPFKTAKVNKSKEVKIRRVKSEQLSDYIRKTIKLTHESKAAGSASAELLDKQDDQISKLKAAISSNPNAIETRMKLASLYHDYGIYDQAFVEYNEVITLDPRNALAYEALGRLWRDWGTPVLAIEDLKTAISLQPDFIDAYNTLGSVYDMLGNYQYAEQAYFKALQKNPNVHSVHNNLCYSYILSKKLDKAIEHCELALKLKPDAAVTHNNLGYLFALTDRTDLALREFTLATDEAGAHNNLGLFYLEKRMYDQAVAEFKRAAELRPGYRKASDNYQLAELLRIKAASTQLSENHLGQEPQRTGMLRVEDINPSTDLVSEAGFPSEIKSAKLEPKIDMAAINRRPAPIK